jgi:hypothetical protein
LSTDLEELFRRQSEEVEGLCHRMWVEQNLQLERFAQ